jgi:hypothetical protein
MSLVNEPAFSPVPEEQVIAAKVRSYIGKHHPGGATLDVLDGGIRKEEEWWYVPVRPNIEPTKRYEYYEALADVENDLEEKENLTVLLVPIAPKRGKLVRIFRRR